jgi:peptidoglycan hydrolase-like protein with peptidoglycan-binding domain
MKKLFVSTTVFILTACLVFNVAFAFTTLKVGSKGTNVKKVQQVLKNHNLNAKVDGQYGAKTAALVKLYQKMHHIKVDGKVGDTTWYSMMGKITVDKYRLKKPVGKLPLKLNSKGDDVKFVQTILKAHKYPVKVDGKYGSGTVKYVKLYQKAHYLKADGKVGQGTWESMAASYTLKPFVYAKATIKMTASRFPIKAGSAANDIKLVQKALVTNKINEALVVTGLYDADTKAAVIKFQQSKGYKQTGEVDILAWEALVATDTDKYNISLLAKIISSESGGANDTEHIAIANVVMDAAVRWKRSIESELKNTNRYGPCNTASKWANFLKKVPGTRCITNAKRAYYGKESVFGGTKAYYFHAKTMITSPGSWWRKIKYLGLVDKHVFYGA